MDNLSKTTRTHSLSMDNRKKITMTGVDKVVSSGDAAISLLTAQGGLLLQGKNLKIVRFSAEDGNFAAEGEIDAIRYSGVKAPLLKRMFK